MEFKFNDTALEKLIEKSKNDKELLDIIFDIFKSFEDYHKAIIEMELKLKVYSASMEREEYQSTVTELDKKRTMFHNSVLTGVNMLNRMAEQAGIEHIYSGTISKERPYRREVANAVLSFLQRVIDNRK